MAPLQCSLHNNWEHAWEIKHLNPFKAISYRNKEMHVFIQNASQFQWASFKALPGLQWILCWPAARPPDVQPGTPSDLMTERWCGRTPQTEFYTEKKKRNTGKQVKRLQPPQPYHICSSGTKLTTCRILFSVSYTEQSCGVTECVKLVIIGISAVGGYKLGIYNPPTLPHRHAPPNAKTPNK